jgi:hypothetical protein
MVDNVELFGSDYLTISENIEKKLKLSSKFSKKGVITAGYMINGLKDSFQFEPLLTRITLEDSDEEDASVFELNTSDGVYKNPDGKYVLVIRTYRGFDDMQKHVCFLYYNKDEDILNLFSKEAVIEPLEPAVYEVSTGIGGTTFVRSRSSDSVSPILNEDFHNTILMDIQRFFDSEDFYNKNGFSYRRGLLLHGSPGCGKSSVIRSVGRQLKLPMLFLAKKLDLDATLKADIERACPQGCIVVIEDIDGVDSYRRSELLNFLDGFSSPKKCYTVATTNFLERIDFAFSRRPSRFDMLLEIKEPDEGTRREILKLYFKDNISKIDVDDVAKKTQGFSGAFLKELYIVFMLSHTNIDSAIDRLRKHMKVAEKGVDCDGSEENYVG